MSYEGPIWALNLGLGVIIVILCAYYIARRRRLDALSRRLVLVGLFYAIHEMSFFLFDPVIYELTKTLFFLTLFYALAYIISMNLKIEKGLEEREKFAVEMKKRLERLKTAVSKPSL